MTNGEASTAPASERQAFRDSIRPVLDAHCGLQALLGHVESGEAYRQGLWQAASELGWLSIAIDEQYGGLGLGWDHLSILYEELGAALAPVPALSTLLIAEAVQSGGSPAQKARCLPRICAGQAIGGLSPGNLLAPGLELLEHQDGELRLRGRLGDLLWATSANLVLVWARGADGALQAILLDSDDAALPRAEPRALVDGTRSLGAIAFVDIPVPAAAVLADAATARSATLAHARLGLACEARGGAARLLARTLDYMKVREQFGRPIGAFQALKHRAASHHVRLEAGAALADQAVQAFDRNVDRMAWSSSAKFGACRAFTDIAKDAIQLHGGAGYAWDVGIHLYLKRAMLSETLFGGGARLLDDLGDCLIARDGAAAAAMGATS